MALSRKPFSSRDPLRRASWYHLVVGLVVAGLFYAVIYYPYEGDEWFAQRLRHYLEWTAQTTAKMIGIFATQPTVQGDIVSGGFSMRIVLDCAALDVLALVSAAILAVPARWQHKVLGLMLTWVGLIAANLTRLAILYWVGEHAPESFDMLHEDVLAMMMVVVALVIFSTWFYWSQRLSIGRSSSRKGVVHGT